MRFCETGFIRGQYGRLRCCLHPWFVARWQQGRYRGDPDGQLSASARVRLLFSLFFSSCIFKDTALIFIIFTTSLPLAEFPLSHESGSASLHYSVGSGFIQQHLDARWAEEHSCLLAEALGSTHIESIHELRGFLGAIQQQLPII